MRAPDFPPGTLLLHYDGRIVERIDCKTMADVKRAVEAFRVRHKLKETYNLTTTYMPDMPPPAEPRKNSITAARESHIPFYKQPKRKYA